PQMHALSYTTLFRSPYQIQQKGSWAAGWVYLAGDDCGSPVGWHDQRGAHARLHLCCRHLRQCRATSAVLVPADAAASMVEGVDPQPDQRRGWRVGPRAVLLW